ncbi:MAG: hypothetical protein JF599_02060 [Verrucomicrobia bacterium]|nr:hypothetical protein [Verrucomicrobiota bacterium]
MKPFKLFACLVTLQFTSGLTLQAADSQEFRKWTDANGRTISARLVGLADASSVKIERADGHVFVVSLKTFSAADQAYVAAFREGKTASELGDAPAIAKADVSPSDSTALTEVAASTWTLLNAGGSLSGASYNNTPLEEILGDLNRQFAAKAVKTATGRPMQIRTEPSDLATRVQIAGDMPGMSLAAFVKEIAKLNDLVVKTDAAGMVVLMDKPLPPSKKPASSYFGVATMP